MNTLQLGKDLNIELNNGRKIIFKYMSEFGNPIFKLEKSDLKITIIDDMLYSISSNDWDEPDSPLIDDFQATEFFSKYTYDFFKSSIANRKI